YALVETGCRPSEIANLEADDIRLDCDVPHIRIRPGKAREIKTRSSIRDIPLVGVSLGAFKEAPHGFSRYRDKPDLLSATLLKAFRARELFPSDDHVIYSFRHSFEKRMLEAGIDYGLRCILMGHRNTRPSYGDGGSLEYRRTELLKIAHPFAQDLFEQSDLALPRAA
ncbi:MAG: tyrosine-type recombinase/integrase, partial [Pseudomonadota bacterium]